MPGQSSEEKLKRSPFHAAQNIRQKYGIDQSAEISPEGEEETESQEYLEGGLPSSTKYTVDKATGRPVIANSRKN